MARAVPAPAPPPSGVPDPAPGPSPGPGPGAASAPAARPRRHLGRRLPVDVIVPPPGVGETSAVRMRQTVGTASHAHLKTTPPSVNTAGHAHHYGTTYSPASIVMSYCDYTLDLRPRPSPGPAHPCHKRADPAPRVRDVIRKRPLSQPWPPQQQVRGDGGPCVSAAIRGPPPPGPAPRAVAPPVAPGAARGAVFPAHQAPPWS